VVTPDGAIERARFEVLPEPQELERMRVELDRLCVLAEAAYDLGMADEYALIEEEAERLARRIEARMAA
jgi:hypothetical protein